MVKSKKQKKANKKNGKPNMVIKEEFVKVEPSENHHKNNRKKHKIHSTEGTMEGERNFREFKAELLSEYKRKAAYGLQLCNPDYVDRDNLWGVPFITTVPTAKVKITYVADLDSSSCTSEALTECVANKQCFFSFSPENILFKPGTNNMTNHTPNPFYYGYRSASDGEWSFDSTQGDRTLSREELLVNFSFVNVAQLRLAAASVNIVQRQEAINIKGSGQVARVYGIPDATKHAHFNRQTILESTYRNTVPSFSTSHKAKLRATWAPADFTDLHLVNPNDGSKLNATVPTIQGYVTGIDDKVKLQATFDFVLEYVPMPSIKAMIPTTRTTADTVA